MCLFSSINRNISQIEKDDKKNISRILTKAISYFIEKYYLLIILSNLEKHNCH